LNWPTVAKGAHGCLSTNTSVKSAGTGSNAFKAILPLM
jgi:hypothetical protein